MAKKQKTVSSVEGFTFDADAADRAVAFFAECLTHTTGEWRGQPFILSDWQADIVRKIFGWKRPDGTRRYRTVFIAVPRKAGKTTLAAGLALYALYCDGEPGAQVINAAADREQALQFLKPPKEWCKPNPPWRAAAPPTSAASSCPALGAATRCYPARCAYSKHGLSCSRIGADELHAWPDRSCGTF